MPTQRPSTYTITAALSYANGPIHIGHLAGIYIPEDIYVRYLCSWGKKNQRLEQTQHLELTWTVSDTQQAASMDLTLDDVIITSEDITGWAVANEGDITVALDITINNALRQEGLARELINRLQNLRKEQGLAVQDKIKITLASRHTFIKEAVQQHTAYICQEIQALQLDVVEAVETDTTFDIDSYRVRVQVTPH